MQIRDPEDDPEETGGGNNGRDPRSDDEEAAILSLGFTYPKGGARAWILHLRFITFLIANIRRPQTSHPSQSTLPAPPTKNHYLMHYRRECTTRDARTHTTPPIILQTTKTPTTTTAMPSRGARPLFLSAACRSLCVIAVLFFCTSRRRLTSVFLFGSAGH